MMMIYRDLKLENIAGNLMIAEYQVDKLRQVESTDQRYQISYINKMKTSSHTFKYGGKWYMLSVKVQELPLDNSNNDSVKAQK